MKSNLLQFDQEIVNLLGYVRGARAETILSYPRFKNAGSVGAFRKRLERLAEKGILAHSSLPAGPGLFRLSSRGGRSAGVPKCWTTSPSLGIAYEMLSVSSFGCRCDEFQFLNQPQLISLIPALAESKNRPMGRFVIRWHSAKVPEREPQLHYWLAECQPVEGLVKRINVIAERFLQVAALRELLELNLLAITTVVPSEGVKSALAAKTFPVSVSVLVLEELRDVIK